MKKYYIFIIFVVVIICSILHIWDKKNTKTHGTLGNLRQSSQFHITPIDSLKFKGTNTWEIKKQDISISKNALEIQAQILQYLTEDNPSKDIAKLDELCINLLNNSNISRHDKMEVFWYVINYFGLDNEIGAYMIDYFSVLQPIEYLSPLIALSTNLSSNTNKHVISTIANMFIVNPSQMEGNLDRINFFSNKKEEAQKFFENQFSSTSLNKDSLTTLLDYFPLVISSGSNLMAIAESNLESNKQLLSPSEFNQYKFNILSMNNERWADFDNFMNSIAKGGSSESTNAINNQLYLGLANSLDTQMLFATHNQNWRETVRNYLPSQKPNIQQINDPMMGLHEYGRWAVSTINLSTGATNTEKVTTFLQKSTPIEQGVLLAYLSNNSSIVSSELKTQLKENGYFTNLKATIPSLSTNDQLIMQSLMPMIDSLDQ